MRLIDADDLYNKYQEAMTKLLSSTNMENISAEAISLLCGSTLLREAPTISGARLLTLEEADKVSCTWVEISSNVIIGPRLIRIVPVDITACMVYTFGADKPTCYNTCNYNRTWRCWSAKPTPEEQLKEKWFDEDTDARAL